MLQSLRKIAISLFFVLHTSALILWVFPPYSDLVLDEQNGRGFVPNIEQHIFSWFKNSQNHAFPGLLNAYVDLIGAHQYWDFFAPEVPKVHRYLRVCPEIIVVLDDDRIGCINPLYKSYDGTLFEAIHSFNGARSRSFRLTENLVRLQRQDLFESFTRYWWNEKTNQKKVRYNQVFLVLTEYPLVLTEYPLHPKTFSPPPEYGRKDSVVWITP